MRRKRNNKAILLGVVLLILAVIAVQQFAVGGFTTIALSKAEFSSNDATIGGEAFILTVVQNGAAGYVEGTINTQQLNDKLAEEGEDERATKNFDLKLSMDKSECVFGFSTENNVVRELEVLDSGKCIFCGSKETTCATNQGTFFRQDGSAFDRDYICVRRNAVAQVGEVFPKGYEFQSTATSVIDGKTHSKSISTTNANSFFLDNDKNIHMSWTGNLATGVDCESLDVTRYRGVYQGQWFVANDDRVSDFLLYDRTWTKCLDAVVQGVDAIGGYMQEDLMACVNEYNAESDLALSGQNVPNGDVVQGNLRIETDEPFQYPQMTFRIKAESLGIVLPVGFPKIASTTAEKFSPGDAGYATAQIRNVGSGDGNFEASISCQENIGVDSTLVAQTVEQGETEAFTFRLSAGNAGCDTCTIFVSDSNNPENDDTATVRVCAEELQPCETGATKCVNGEEPVVCDAGKWVSDSTRTCKEEPTSNQLALILGIIGGAVLLILSMIIAKQAMRKKGKKRKR